MNSLETTLSKFKISNRKGNRLQAFCPAHDDKKASLSILVSEDRLLLFCHAGCRVEDVLKAANLTFSDLFVDKPPVAIYQYRNQDGGLSHEKLKYLTAKGKKFTQRRIEGECIVDNLDDIPRIPFNYPLVIEAVKTGATVIFTEGEKDADTARMLGYIGTTMGGASDWRDEFKYFFKNANMIIIPDKDVAGTAHAKKVSASLVEVCKSAKVVILPEGKDLTEWVELGNSDLEALIVGSNELVTKKGIPEPKVKILSGAYKFSWNGLNLNITIDRIRNDEEGEISVYEGTIPIYISGIKLLSVSHRTALARALKSQRNLDWEKVLNQVATECLTHLRKGESIVLLDSELGSKRPEYLLPPLFVKNAVNIIYADKSSAKSLFMILVALGLTLPWFDNEVGLNIKNKSYKTLYLDWENDPHITGWQKECLIRGMKKYKWCDLPYLHCSRPLLDSIDHIKAKIIESQAKVIIIDSLGMAVGEDLNLTKPAFNFFAALRQLPATPILVAHTSKDISNRRKTVYGNAYYENEARSVWEVSKQQEFGSNELTITLHHRKAPPFAGYHEPLAFRFVFEGNKTLVEKAEADTDKRSNIDEPLTENDVALNILMASDKPLRPKDIAVESKGGIKPTNIGTVLKRLIQHPSYNVHKTAEGLYYYNEESNRLL